MAFSAALEPYHLMTYTVFVPSSPWSALWSILYSQTTFVLFLAHFARLLILPCSTSLVLLVIPIAVRPLPSVVSLCKYVAENYSGSLSGPSDWCEAFELLADRPFSDFSATDARSDDIVLEIPSSSIVTVYAVNDRVRYEPHLGGSNFE